LPAAKNRKRKVCTAVEEAFSILTSMLRPSLAMQQVRVALSFLGFRQAHVCKVLAARGPRAAKVISVDTAADFLQIAAA
jgi:hypothetical protein